MSNWFFFLFTSRRFVVYALNDSWNEEQLLLPQVFTVKIFVKIKNNRMEVQEHNDKKQQNILNQIKRWRKNKTSKSWVFVDIKNHDIIKWISLNVNLSCQSRLRAEWSSCRTSRFRWERQNVRRTPRQEKPIRTQRTWELKYSGTKL